MTIIFIIVNTYIYLVYDKICLVSPLLFIVTQEFKFFYNFLQVAAIFGNPTCCPDFFLQHPKYRVFRRISSEGASEEYLHEIANWPMPVGGWPANCKELTLLRRVPKARRGSTVLYYVV